MKLSHRVALALAPIVAASVVGGCGVRTDKAVAKAAVDTSTEGQRKKAFEATAQILDEDPALSDELYSVMRLHPKAMDRFMANASTDLDQKWIAKNMAGYIAKNPAGLEEVTTAALPAIAKEPKARAAIHRSLAGNSDIAADIITDNPETLAKMVKSLLKVTEKKPAARQNLVTAVHLDRAAIVAFVKEDKALAHAIAIEVVKETVKDKPTLEKVIAATGVLDQPEGAPAPAPPAPAKAKAKTPEPPPAKIPPGGGPTPPPVTGK